ncbi:MAG: hypothetical protein J5U17_01935 [Candidatus Methanoperedens sp.]|nr:hypothetical protein [Candidatus Methanoperedens sp.]MCE8424522.1 hypothetical protein [Candidatus Methanoperedens sp.]MCE8426936.1 hypothetical protein [Candidatus Methanoperedens sp.]
MPSVLRILPYRHDSLGLTQKGVVYDNVHGVSEDIDAANPQVIGGGSIVIHK